MMDSIRDYAGIPRHEPGTWAFPTCKGAIVFKILPHGNLCILEKGKWEHVAWVKDESEAEVIIKKVMSGAGK
jgi:hypothetical protein